METTFLREVAGMGACPPVAKGRLGLPMKTTVFGTGVRTPPEKGR